MNVIIYVYPHNTHPAEVTLPRDPTLKESSLCEFYVMRPTHPGVEGTRIELVVWDATVQAWVVEEVFSTAFSIIRCINQLKDSHDDIHWIYLNK